MNRVDKWFANVYEGFSIIPMCMRKPSTRVRSGPFTTLPSCSPAYTTGPLVYTPHRDYPLLRIRMDGVSMSLVMETVEINEPFANPMIGFPLFLF